jgi:hypothetical protein
VSPHFNEVLVFEVRLISERWLHTNNLLRHSVAVIDLASKNLKFDVQDHALSFRCCVRYSSVPPWSHQTPFRFRLAKEAQCIHSAAEGALRAAVCKCGHHCGLETCWDAGLCDAIIVALGLHGVRMHWKVLLLPRDPAHRVFAFVTASPHHIVSAVDRSICIMHLSAVNVL